jgi:hypothetical protein
VARRRGIGSLEGAAAAVDRLGLAVVWGKADLVLPSLWQEIAGPDADWAIRDETGKSVAFTPEFERLWRWKDELPEQGLACAGRHFGDAALLIALRLVPAAYALTGRSGAVEDFRDDELEALEREVAEAVLENGPLTGRELRVVLATNDRKAVDRTVRRLQRRLVLTNAGAVEQDQGWRAIRQDLFARRWAKSLRRLPGEEEARRELALTVLAGTDDVSAADLAAALGWRRKQAEAVLVELCGAGNAHERLENDLRIWSIS